MALLGFSSVLGEITLGLFDLGALSFISGSSTEIVFDLESLTFTEHLEVLTGGSTPPTCEPVPDQDHQPALRFVQEPYESAGS